MSGYVHATDKGLYPPSPQIPDSENPSVGWVNPTGQGLNDWFAYVGAIRYDIYNGTDPDVGADPNLSGFTNWAAALGDGSFAGDIATTVDGDVQSTGGAKPIDADMVILLTDGAPTVGPTHGGFGWANDPNRVPEESGAPGERLNLDHVRVSTNDAIRQADVLRAAGVRVEIVTVPVGDNSYPDDELVQAVANDPSAVHEADYSTLGDTLAEIVRGECGPGDASVTKTADQSPVYDGDTVTWDVEVAWDAEDRTSAPIRVTDTVGTGTVVDMSVDPAFGQANGDGTVTVNPMTPGQAPVVVTVTSTVDGFDGQKNSVTIAQDCGDDAECTIPPGDDPENNTASASVPGVSADMQIVKTGPAQYRAGSEVTYTVRATNAGPDRAVNATLRDLAGPGLTLTGVNDDRCDIADDGKSLDCILGDLNSGDHVDLTIDGTTTEDASGLLVNYAETGSETPDPDPTNNTDKDGAPDPNQPQCTPGYPGCTDATPLPPEAGPSADVSVVKEIKGSPEVKTGDTVTFNLTLRNSGPDAALDVVAADEPADGLTFTSMRIVEPGSAEGLKVEGNLVVADRLPVGAVVKLEADFEVTANEGVVKNIFFATSSDEVPDPDPTNNVDDGPANPHDPNDGDSDCTLQFVGCSSVTVVNPSPPTTAVVPPPDLTTNRITPGSPAPNLPSTPGVRSPSSPTPLPGTPGKPSTSVGSPIKSLPNTGVSVGLLAMFGAALVGGGLVVRRRGASKKEVPA